MALGTLEQPTGLMTQMVIAAQFGTSQIPDAYLVAMAVVGLIRAWVSRPIKQNPIPMFRQDLARQREQVAWANVITLFNNLLVVLPLIAITT